MTNQNQIEVHELVLQNMKEMAAKFSSFGVSLELPPASNIALGTKYVGLDLGKSLAAEFLFDDKFTNPLKMLQGGFLCAAFDEVFGPLTYMAAKTPVVTLEMSTSFIRPFTAKDESITIKAEVISKTKTVLILKAEARTKAGRLVATATNHSLVVSDSNLQGK